VAWEEVTCTRIIQSRKTFFQHRHPVVASWPNERQHLSRTTWPADIQLKRCEKGRLIEHRRLQLEGLPLRNLNKAKPYEESTRCLNLASVSHTTVRMIKLAVVAFVAVDRT
jgi:hypothetical protein